MPIEIVKILSDICNNVRLEQPYTPWSILFSNKSNNIACALFTQDNSFETYSLLGKGEIKNCNNEIDAFFEWIKPYVKVIPGTEILIGYKKGKGLEFKIVTGCYFDTFYSSPKARAKYLLTDTRNITSKVIEGLLNKLSIPCNYQLLTYNEVDYVYVITSEVLTDVFNHMTVTEDLSIILENYDTINLQFNEELNSAINKYNQTIKDKKLCDSV